MAVLIKYFELLAETVIHFLFYILLSLIRGSLILSDVTPLTENVTEFTIWTCIWTTWFPNEILAPSSCFPLSIQK